MGVHGGNGGGACMGGHGGPIQTAPHAPSLPPLPPFQSNGFFLASDPPPGPPPPPCSQWVSLSSMLLQKAEYGGEGSPEYQQLVELDEKHVCLTQVWRQHVWNPV